MMNQYAQVKQQLLQNQHTWLITGVAGFIGSNLLEALLNLNQKVIGLDNFSTGYQHNLDEVKKSVSAEIWKNFHFIEGDISEFEDCKKAIQGVDYVLHQAALASVPRSIENPLAMNRANVNGFLNLLFAAEEANCHRFVYASSSSVYGDAPELPKREEQVGHPLSPYAASKYANELYAYAFGNCYGIETIGLRYFNVFGRRQDPNGAYAAVIPLWFKAILNGEDLIVNGDGSTSRDFCYIDNVVQANIMAALTDHSEAPSKAYNIAVGEQMTLKDLYEALIDFKLADRVNIIHQDFRAGDIKHSLADISRAREYLGYAPEYTAKEGLKKAKEWYYRYFTDR